MKRFLSILLAVMLVMTLVPAVSAEETATENVATERVYVLNSAAVSDYSDPTVWDKTMTGKYQQASIYPLIGYGTHGYKFWDVDDISFGNLAACERSMNFNSLYLRVWATCSESSHPIKTPNPDGLKLALALEKPSSVASFYSVTFETNGSDGTSNMSVYMDELDENKKTVEEYTLPENLLDSEYVASNSVKTFKELVYSDGESDLLIAFALASGRTRMYDVTLTPVEVSAIAFKNTRKELLIDEEMQLQILATVGTTTQPVSHGFVTYKSSDEDILTVDASGVVRAVSDGTATVTATVGSFSKTISITVGNKVYMMPANYVDTTEPGVWDTTIANYNSYKGTPIPIRGYGSHGWKYIDVDDWTYNRLPAQVRLFQFQAVNIRFFSEHDAEADKNPGPIKAAFALEKPEQNGFYLFKIGVDGGDGSGIMTPYMSYLDDTKTTVESYATAQNQVSVSYDTAGSTGKVLDKLVYADGENDLVIALSLKGRTRLMQFSLIPQRKVTDIKITAPESILLGESATAKVFGAGTSFEVGNGFVTYESSNKAAATIDECGIITPVATGKTTITATVGPLSKSVEVEVIAEDEELKDAFDFEEEEFASAPLSSATVYTFSVKLGESADKDSTTLNSATVNLGETYTVTAPEAEEGYKFLYWAKGMSTDRKQIVSYSESYSFIPTVENTYLIAVYEATSGEGATDKAEFYNANGQLIATLTADGKAPALPEMAGYEAAEGWALYGTNEVISANADVTVSGTKVYVAKFGNPITVKVNGNNVAYGEKVSFTAAPGAGEVFKCWKKNDVIVSTASTYSFYAWKDCDVEAVYVTDEVVFTGKAMKILVDTFSAGEENAIMAEFIGFADAVEKGIMLGNRRYAMATDATQFTIVNDISETEVVGYAIFKDGKIVYDK